MICYIICNGIETIMHHYTLAWHDQGNTEQHICEYADTAWEAARHAREDVPYLREHPYSLYEILNEDHLFKNGKLTS